MSPRGDIDVSDKTAVEFGTAEAGAAKDTATKQAATSAVAAPQPPPWWSFASIRGRIEDEMDEQRHERLMQCRSLESVLADCRAQKPNRPQLEDLPAGIRMVRYFDWRDVPDPHCQREAHAVWACRAVALKCGKELLQVRDCFHNCPDNPATTTTATIGQGSPDKKTAILHYRTGSDAYEPTSSSSPSSSDIDTVPMSPCAKVQQALGRCVSINAHELLERDIARRQK